LTAFAITPVVGEALGEIAAAACDVKPDGRGRRD
jgi:hypothetical protein